MGTLPKTINVLTAWSANTVFSIGRANMFSAGSDQPDKIEAMLLSLESDMPDMVDAASARSALFLRSRFL